MGRWIVISLDQKCSQKGFELSLEIDFFVSRRGVELVVARLLAVKLRRPGIIVGQ